MDENPALRAVLGDHDKCAAQRLQLLLLDFLEAQELGQGGERLLTDFDLLVLLCLLIFRSGWLREHLLDHLIKILEDVKNEKV